MTAKMLMRTYEAIIHAFLVGAISIALMFAISAESHANAKYAGVVIDAKTGRTLYADRADAARYPASLTKMMTLYLTFDALERGRISESTRMPVSRNAAAEVPTKLGLRSGQKITVEQAILGLVTRSANDAATVLAEFLGGSEPGFAHMMTSRARELGMTSTTFRNAHGLPHAGQRTTARDMARLGMALRDHHPEQYRYFQTRSFTYNGRTYRNHNRLLGKVKGVDGIKTGFIRASGFNLVTSLKSDDRSIVAVVMGGRSGRSRNAHMIDLIDRYLSKASQGPDRFRIEKPGSDLLLAKIGVPSGPVPLPLPRPGDVLAASFTTKGETIERDADFGMAPRSANVAVARKFDNAATGSIGRSGWVVQIGSMPSASQARNILKNTKNNARALIGNKAGFVQPFEMDGTIYHRARFRGFKSKEEAWTTCEALIEESIQCYAVRHSVDLAT